MTTKTRVLRNLAVYTAGFLPFALLWRSIGVVPSFLIGAVAVVVVAAIFRRHDAKSRQSRWETWAHVRVYPGFR